MLGDMSAESADGDAITESYVCPEGFAGRYRLLIRRVWGEVTAGKVNVEITVAKGTDIGIEELHLAHEGISLET